MSNFIIFKAAFNNSVTPAIGTYTAEGATAFFSHNSNYGSSDYYLCNYNDNTAVQWFVPTKETTDFEFVADILTRQWSNNVTYFAITDSTGTTRLRMWSKNDNWYFENSDSTATVGDPEYIGVIDPTTSGGFGKFHRFRVRVHKLTESSSSVEVYVDGELKLTATAGAALVTCAKLGFVGGVSTWGPGSSVGIKNVYVYDLSDRPAIDRSVLSEAFNKFIEWSKSNFALKRDLPSDVVSNLPSSLAYNPIQISHTMQTSGTWTLTGVVPYKPVMFYFYFETVTGSIVLPDNGAGWVVGARQINPSSYNYNAAATSGVRTLWDYAGSGQSTTAYALMMPLKSTVSINVSLSRSNNVHLYAYQ